MIHADALTLLEETLSSLKDFQQATVESVLHQFEYGSSQRVLVADEVGLGKTIVAKGVIARLLKARLEKNNADAFDQPLRITYICSNQTLAEENRAKLAVFKGASQKKYVKEPSYGRLITTAMRDKITQNDKDKLLEVCSLTPSTSFNLTDGPGNWVERMIILFSLLSHPILSRYERQLRNFLQGAVGTERWLENFRNFKASKILDANIAQCFHLMLAENITDSDAKRCGLPAAQSWLTLLQKIATNEITTLNDRGVRSCLRVLLAKACSKSISADLFILDEFQRFKGLLDTNAESEESVIARQVFSSPDKSTKILLLSATPFKAYSQNVDDENGDAHSEALQFLLSFLSNDDKDVLKNYNELRRKVHHQILDLKNPAVDIKSLDKTPKVEMESCLKAFICRTERSQVSDGYETVFQSIKNICDLEFSGKDIVAYRAMDSVGEALHKVSKGRYGSQLMEFYKATPWALSFLSGYQFKKQLEAYRGTPQVKSALVNSTAAWLPRSSIAKYKLKLSESPHAKIKALTKYLFRSESEKLLWVPPSRPNYPLVGCFKGQENFSKTLLFSSWAIVPRALSGLISYEAERRVTYHLSKTERDYFRNRSPKIKFDRSASLAGISLVYPSKVLIECGVDCNQTSLSVILKKRTNDFSKALKSLSHFEQGKRSGDTWYALAPMLLDLNTDSEYVASWLNTHQFDNTEQSSGINIADKVKEVYKILNAKDGIQLGPMPLDLAEYLAYLSVACPAVCVARSWKKFWPEDDVNILIKATAAAKGAVSLFNKAESENILIGLYGKKKYFLSVAQYCAEGDFQSVVDEYGHLLAEAGIDKATTKLTETLGFSPSRVNCHFAEDLLGEPKGNSILRCHYAVPLGNQTLTDESGLKRVSSVRDAFNSPFRPFVLNSTSIGQEGLDFHWYCRQVVHWNIPSNPIDIEQREGRVNRYKSHVVRHRLAESFSHFPFVSNKDNWAKLFQNADDVTKAERQSDLVPYWHYPSGKSTIDRYVPMMPMSKEASKLDHALKVLVHYRLAFGQPRQEELLENLLKREFTEDDITYITKNLIVNLSPTKRKFI